MSKLLRVVCLILILFSIITVFIVIPQEHEFAKGADEGYYFRYASLVYKNGIREFSRFINEYNTSPESFLFPKPSRIGHILLTACWFKFFGVSFVSLARFSFFCYLLFLLTCFCYSKKFFSRDIAYLFTLLVSVSPLIMAMAKRALSDSSLNLFWALSIWSFLDFLKTQKRYKFIIFLIIYSSSILIKESSLVLLLPFVLFSLLYKFFLKKPLSSAYILNTIFLPFCIVGILYLFLCGGISNCSQLIARSIDAHFIAVKESRYAVFFCSGPWYRYILDYLLLTPITTLLFIGYIGYEFVIKKWEWERYYFFIYILIVFLILGNLNYNKVVRFVINFDMVISLFSIFMLYEIFRQKNARNQVILVFSSVAVIFFINYMNFIKLFCQYNIYDPVTYWLLAASKLIPLYSSVF